MRYAATLEIIALLHQSPFYSKYQSRRLRHGHIASWLIFWRMLSAGADRVELYIGEDVIFQNDKDGHHLMERGGIGGRHISKQLVQRTQ